MNENTMGIWRDLFGWVDQSEKTLHHVSKETRCC